MAELLAFQLKLTDAFASTLNPPISALDRFAVKLQQVTQQTTMFEQKAGKAIGNAFAQTKTFLTVDVVNAAKVAFDAISRVVGGFYNFGKSIVQVAAEFQDLQLAMKLDLGEAGAARLQGIADSFGASRFDDDLINKALLPFAQMGIKDEVLLDRIATAAGDLSARLNTGNAGFLEYTDAFKKLALKGEVDAKSLKALQIGEADYYKNLGGFLKVSAKQAEELAKKGKIDSQVLIATALDEVAKRQGGALGGGTNAAGKTLGGTLARLGNLFGNVFKPLANMQGMARLQGALDKFITFASGDGGAGIVKVIDVLLVKGVDLAERFAAFAGDVSAFARDNAIIGEVVGGVFGTIGEMVGTVVDGIGGAIKWLSGAFVSFADGFAETMTGVQLYLEDMWEGLGDFFDNVVNGFTELGWLIVDGLVSGITAAWETAKGTVKGLWTGLIDDAKGVFEIQSPSKVFAEIGRYNAEGMAIGLESGGQRVEDAARQSIADTVFAGLRRIGDGSPTSTTAAGAGPQINVTVQLVQQPGQSTPEVARELGAELRPILVDIFRQVAL